MRITAELDYAGAGPHRVFAMLADPGFLARCCQATGALSQEVEVRRPDGGSHDGASPVTLVTTRVMPTDTVPDLVRSMVGSTLTVRRIDTWGGAAADGSRSGRIEVTIVDTPVSMTGTLALSPNAAQSQSGAGATEVVDGELTASVPLIGGRIARAAEPAVRAGIDVEHRIGLAWLTDPTHAP